MDDECFRDVSDWVESTLVCPVDVAMFVFSPPINFFHDGIKIHNVILGKYMVD